MILAGYRLADLLTRVFKTLIEGEISPIIRFKVQAQPTLGT